MMHAANVIPFPAREPRYREAPRQAMARSGMPVRKRDSVLITDTAARKFAGTVQKVGGDEYSDVCLQQLYEVICNDGYRRVVTADQIEALS